MAEVSNFAQTPWKAPDRFVVTIGSIAGAKSGAGA